MVPKEHFTIEAHSSAATLYMTGAVSVPGLLAAMRRCEELPPSVWLLRVDLSGVSPLDQGTQGVLRHALRRWRDSRSGATEIGGLTPNDEAVTQALHIPCRTMTRRAHFARMLTPRR